MNRFLASVFLVCLGIALTVCIMIYGWGLTPQSWWWIIGGGFFGRVLIAVVEIVQKEKK